MLLLKNLSKNMCNTDLQVHLQKLPTTKPVHYKKYKKELLKCTNNTAWFYYSNIYPIWCCYGIKITTFRRNTKF